MDNNIDDLKHIRSMMERSTKFLSLSGISGVMAGAFALLGAVFAYLDIKGILVITDSIITDFYIIAGIVLICAAASGFYFSLRKAQKTNSKFAVKQIITEFAIPMVVGGCFCLILIYQNCAYLVGSAMLIFYGLALVYAGSRTYRDIKVLGACEIVLGLLAGVLIGYGLYIWAFGFGVLHIVYGIAIYYKYDKKVSKEN